MHKFIYKGLNNNSSSRTPLSRQNLTNLLILSLSLAYGLIISSIPNDNFSDFENYVNYADYSSLIISNNIEIGTIYLFSNEPLWLLLNATLSEIMPPENVVRLIIFASSTTLVYTLIVNNKNDIIPTIIFIFLTIVLKNYIIHLRQGFAISIFILAWLSKRNSIKVPLMAMAPLVHSSFFFVLALLLITKIANYLRIDAYSRILIVAIFAFIISLNIYLPASILGARQAQEYEFGITGFSGIGFLFWLAIFYLWLTEGSVFLKTFSFEFSIICFDLFSYWFLEVSGRIFESGVILVLLASLRLSSIRRQIFILAITVYGGLIWASLWNEPLLGFAAKV